jgi:hypothetical protein
VKVNGKVISEEKNNLHKIGSLDFKNNKRLLILSYVLRLAGILFFGYLFFFLARAFAGNNYISLGTLLEIEIDALPPIASILLLVVCVILVLYMHEIIHAAVFYFTHRQKPQVGIRGLIIFAAAPDTLLTKRELIVNAIAPFTVLSLLGIAILSLLPHYYMSWIFIPVVVNAAASGGDFMTIMWISKQPKGSKFIDIGDATTAYTEI